MSAYAYKCAYWDKYWGINIERESDVIKIKNRKSKEIESERKNNLIWKFCKELLHFLFYFNTCIVWIGAHGIKYFCESGEIYLKRNFNFS